MGFPGSSAFKNPPTMQESAAGDGWGRVPWKRAWQPTPVFLPGEPHGTEGQKELDTTVET